METGTDNSISKEPFEQSGLLETGEFEAHTPQGIVTPPARENTEVDADFIDELEEIFGLDLDDETENVGQLNIDDIPLDGKSPEFSSESADHDNTSESNLNAELIEELEKMASQSDADIHGEQNSEQGTDATNSSVENDEGYCHDSIPETRDTDTVTPNTGLGYTTRSATELQMSTWRSTLVTDCESASLATTERENLTIEARPEVNDRMSSGKKSTVQFYEDEDDIELSR